MKDCLIIGPAYAFSYDDAVKLLIEKVLKVGIWTVKWLIGKGPNAIGSSWFTTLQVNRPEEKKLIITKTYNKDEYPVLDNYDAIYCNSKDVPVDYEGKIAVPMTFLKYYDYLPYDILELRTDLKLNGKTKFPRLIIRRKQL